MTTKTSIKTKQLYIIPVLVEKVATVKEDYVFVRLYCDVLNGLVKNGTVKKEDFIQQAKEATVMDMSDASIYKNYYYALKINKETLSWDEATAAMLVGERIARQLWIENHVSLTVYQKGDLDQHGKLMVYSNGRVNFSTGWEPTEEDKLATDWVIV